MNIPLSNPWARLEGVLPKTKQRENKHTLVGQKHERLDEAGDFHAAAPGDGRTPGVDAAVWFKSPKTNRCANTVRSMKQPEGRAHNPSRRQAGVALIECIVYFALLAMVLGLATTAFYRCWDDNKHLRRNADDIVRALHAGEQWRTDVRAATRPIQASNPGDGEKVVIPVKAGQIVYSFAQGQVRRQVRAGVPAALMLDHVKASQMQAEPRQSVTAWRWELELQPEQKQVQMQPLFTFETVAGHNLAR
jgi:Tfp pilus assembly protein FimT